MTEVVITTPQGPPVTDKNIATIQAHGLHTPESTPPPEDARIKADKARRAAQNTDSKGEPKGDGAKGEDDTGRSKDEAKGDGAKGEEDTGRSKKQTNDGDKSAATGDAATSNKPDGMEGLEKTTPRPGRTPWHLEMYDSCGQILGALVNGPERTDLIKELDTINNSIREYNTNNGFSKDQFVIDYSPYIPAFKEAAPYRATLATKRDKDAKDKIESINKGLEEHNKKHDYPSIWLIAIPEPPAEPPVRPPRGRASKPTASRTQGGRSTNSRALTEGKALTINQTPGHVYDGGVQKEVAGYVKAGFGHRLLLRQDGEDEYDIYELVRASKFGKNFIDRNQDVLEGKEMKVGTKGDLKGMDFNNVKIFGVAPVRIDSDYEALMAWLQFPGKQPFWYWRGWLGDEMGLDIVDGYLDRYMKKAGQRLRGDTTDEDGEVEDTQDSEDDDGLDDEAKLHVLMKQVENLQKRLKKSGKKSSTSSRKSKSKRAK